MSVKDYKSFKSNNTNKWIQDWTMACIEYKYGVGSCNGIYQILKISKLTNIIFQCILMVSLRWDNSLYVMHGSYDNLNNFKRPLLLGSYTIK